MYRKTVIKGWTQQKSKTLSKKIAKAKRTGGVLK
jgi:hypothetical protein